MGDKPETKMWKNILFTAILIPVLFTFTKSQNPLDTCTHQEQAICLNCQTVAKCNEDESNPGTFTARNTTNSPCLPDNGLYCDDTTPLNSGTCFRYDPRKTKCACNGSTNCLSDPNNGNVYIPCEGANQDITGTAFYCEPEKVLWDTCTCFVEALSTTARSTTEVLISTTPGRNPVDSCTTQGQTICLNCQMVAVCEEDENNPGAFMTSNITKCETDYSEFCNSTVMGDFGVCVRLQPTSTKCDCDGTTNCLSDPYNGNVYIPCEGANQDITGTAFYCEPEKILWDTCTCFEEELSTTTMGTTISLTSSTTTTMGTTISLTSLTTTTIETSISESSATKISTREFTKSTTPGGDPVNSCTTQGQTICLNCQIVALCEEVENNPGTFTALNTTDSKCSPDDGLFCDDTSVLVSGTCCRYQPEKTKCACDGTTNCQNDPNNINVYIPCEGVNQDITGTAFYCEPGQIQWDTCTCFEEILFTTITSEDSTTKRSTTEFAKSTTPKGKPVDSCTAQGQKICLNCQTVAICVEDEETPGTFTAINTTDSECSPEDGFFCDDTSLLVSGTCSRYQPDKTKCACDGTTNCLNDPNNANVYIPCEGINQDITGTAFYCEPEQVQWNTCTCFDEALSTARSTTEFAESTTLGGNPVDSCTEQGQTICLNCQTVAVCVEDENIPGSFMAINTTNSECSPDVGLFCDDTSSLVSGICSRYQPDKTDCACDGTTNCLRDPNNVNVYIPCEGVNQDITGTAFYCEPEKVLWDTCACYEDTLTTTVAAISKVSMIKTELSKSTSPGGDRNQNKEMFPQMLQTYQGEVSRTSRLRRHSGSYFGST